jgi:hypothetical protein
MGCCCLGLITQAQRSLDLQYYIFRGDESGRLVTEALLAAARRGVRMRILSMTADGAGDDGCSRSPAARRDPSSIPGVTAGTAPRCAAPSISSAIRGSTIACTTSCSSPTRRWH